MQTALRAVFFIEASAAKFWKRDISSALERAFPVVFGDFFGCSTSSKRIILVHKNTLVLVNGVVIASSHALWRVLSNKAIWVLGHVKICRPQVRHSPCCTLFLINYFGIEILLCHLYLKRFDLTKGLLFETFFMTVWYKLCRCDHSVLELESFPPPMNW